MDWFIFWIIVYLVVIIALTIRHIRNSDVEGYLINNRNTATLPLVFTTLATFVGGGTSIGLMALGYESGFAAVAIGIAYVIGFIILSRYAGLIQEEGKRFNIYSFTEYLNRAYLKKHKLALFPRLFSSLVNGVNIFIFFFLLAAQFVAMASILELTFNIGYLYAAIISCLVVIGYTAFAGLAGVIITDMLQFVVILIMIGIIFIPGVLSDTEGLTRLSELPPKMLNGTFYGVVFLVALPLFLAPSVMVRMDIWQRVLAAKNRKAAKRMSIISGAGMLPFYLIFPLVGMAIRLNHGQGINPNDVTYLFLSDHSTPFLLGFAIIGLLAALMSSGDSFLNIISLSAVRDFVGWKDRSKEIPKEKVRKNIRIAVWFFGFFAMFMALALPKIVDLMVMGLATIVIFVPVTFLALIKKDVYKYKYDAFFSVAAGFIVNLAFFIYGVACPEQFDPKSSFIPAFLIALATLLTGIRFRRK